MRFVFFWGIMQRIVVIIADVSGHFTLGTMPKERRYKLKYSLKVYVHT